MKRHAFFLFASSSLLALSTIHAASTWNGGTAVSTDGFWATATNWSADTAPLDGADLIFDGADNKTSTNNIPLATIGSITFNNATWNLTLGTAALNGGITAAGTATLGGTLTLGAPQSWTNTTGLLTVSGTVANGSNLLTVGGAGNTTVSAVIGNGAGGLTKTGAGTLTLTGSTNAFSGQLTVQNGNLAVFAVNDVSTNGRLGNSALPVILGNTGTQTGVLQYTGNTATSTKPFTMATGGIGAFNITTATTALTLSGIIDGGGALSKTGPGTLTLSNTSNTYSGGTILNAGTLFIGANGNLGDAAGGITFTGNASLSSSATFTTARLITVNSGVTATLIPTNTWTNSGKVTGDGGLAFNSLAGNGPHASLLTNTGNDFTGAILVEGNGGGQTNSATFNSLVDSASVGAGNISIGSNSNGNSAGSTVVFNYGSGAIAPLTLNNRRIRLIGSGSNNNGTGATFSNQSTTQAVTINTDLLAAGGNGKLTLSAAAGPTNVFAGLIANGSANAAGVIINKTGTGTWAFSGANTYTGSTLVAAGTLTINSISNPGLASPIGASSGISLSLTGGTLQYAPINALGAAGHLTTRNFGLVASSTIDASGTGALVFNAPTDNIVSPDSSGLTFTSSGRTISGLASTAKLAAGMKFTGTGVAANSTIVSIDSATQVSINNAVTTAGTNANGAFGFGDRTLTLTGTNTDANTIAGNLVNSAATGAGVLTLAKSGGGTWVLTGTNTYSGTTSINGGVLEAIDGTSLPSGSGLLQLRGGVFQSSGTFTRNVNATAGAGGVNWSTSSGGFAAKGAPLVLNLNGGTASLTWNGSSFVQDARSLIFGSASADNRVDFQNAINLGSGTVQTRTITVNDNSGSTTDVARISGAISNTTAGMNLLKDGTGTLELTGTNSYTGTTTVSQGTLALIGGSQTSAISVSTGASLGFTIGSPSTSTAALDLTNGTVKITGTPSSASHLLMTASAGIIGTPTLFAAIPGYTLVKANSDTELRLDSTGGGSAYSTWASTNAPLPQTPDGDFDGDGVSNAVEFVLGGLATTNDLGKLPMTATSGGNMTFTFRRAQSSIDPKTGTTIEVGTDLATWNTAPSPYIVTDGALANNPGVTVVKDSPTAGTDTITLTVPQTPDAKKFARLKVVITP